MRDLTRLFESIEAGDRGAASELVTVVYDELRRLAAFHLKAERPDHTLGATALVHETYLRLVRKEDREWRGRSHFFAAASEAMRRILVDSARRRKALKRGGSRGRIDLDEVALRVVAPDGDVLGVDGVIDELASVDDRAAQVVKLHYFVGMSMEDVAVALGIAERTAYRDWSFARAWLRSRLSGRGDAEGVHD